MWAKNRLTAGFLKSPPVGKHCDGAGFGWCNAKMAGRDGSCVLRFMGGGEKWGWAAIHRWGWPKPARLRIDGAS